MPLMIDLPPDVAWLGDLGHILILEHVLVHGWEVWQVRVENVGVVEVAAVFVLGLGARRPFDVL